MPNAEFADDVLKRLDRPAPRYTSYPTVPFWQRDFRGGEFARRLEIAGRDEGPLSLYFHLPFCRRLCTYCGCNVVITSDPRRADVYIDDLVREMDLVASRLGARRTVAQLHWGGGTPTFLDEEQLERLWSEISTRFQLTPDAEAAIEIDPRSTSAKKLERLRRLGFNRLSVGIQDFDPAVQWAAGRVQGFEGTAELIANARTLGYASIGVDLIYGLPLQIEHSWRQTVEQVVRLRPDRVATYSFAYVPKARPHQKKLGRFPIPRGPDKLRLHLIADDLFTEAGYRAIGFDHYALAGDELVRAQVERRLRRSFQGYTVRATDDLIGFGATAVSEVAGAYAQNVRPLGAYATAVRSGRFATERGYAMTDDDLRRRRVIESLLCGFSVVLDEGDARELASAIDRLAPLERDGVVRVEGATITVTQLGRPFARLVAMAFDAHLDRAAEMPVYSQSV